MSPFTDSASSFYSSDALMEVSCSLAVLIYRRVADSSLLPPFFLLPQQCVRDSQASLRKAGTMRRAKSVFHSKNLGTIKQKKKEKQKKGEEGNAGNADIIMRILRMRFVLFSLAPLLLSIRKLTRRSLPPDREPPSPSSSLSRSSSRRSSLSNPSKLLNPNSFNVRRTVAPVDLEHLDTDQEEGSLPFLPSHQSLRVATSSEIELSLFFLLASFFVRRSLYTSYASPFFLGSFSCSGLALSISSFTSSLSRNTLSAVFLRSAAASLFRFVALLSRIPSPIILDPSRSHLFSAPLLSLP